MLLFHFHSVAATPLSRNKNIKRDNSLHQGILLRDGIFDQVNSDQLLDKTILKKGWESAALYIFGDKSLLRVCLLICCLPNSFIPFVDNVTN